MISFFLLTLASIFFLLYFVEKSVSKIRMGSIKILVYLSHDRHTLKYSHYLLEGNCIHCSEEGFPIQCYCGGYIHHDSDIIDYGMVDRYTCDKCFKSYTEK